MAWEMVAEGSNINDIASVEANEIAEGQRAKLDCQTLVPVATWQMDALRNSLDWAGIEELGVSGSGNKVSITWRKGFLWAAVIILALVAVIVVVLWQMFKDVPMPARYAGEHSSLSISRGM